MNLFVGFTAFFLGALHALEPGHGKSAIAAYAVGYRSSFRHILVLGLSTAIAHTATILALALILGATVSYVADENAVKYIEIGSAFLLLGTGAWLWRRAVKNRKSADACGDSEKNVCDCHKKRVEADGENKPVSLGVVSLLGISVGLLPCPTALAVLLSSMTAGHFYGGLWTVCLFSIGIALTISTIALAAFFFANSSFAARFQNHFKQSRLTHYLPVLSAWIIIGSGFFTLFRAMFHS